VRYLNRTYRVLATHYVTFTLTAQLLWFTVVTKSFAQTDKAEQERKNEGKRMKANE
jgi:hypothetical protein